MCVPAEFVSVEVAWVLGGVGVAGVSMMQQHGACQQSDLQQQVHDGLCSELIVCSITAAPGRYDDVQ